MSTVAQAAYDLERFENRPLESKPRMRAVQGKKQTMKINTQKIKMIALCVMMVGLTAGLLESQATITELTSQVQRTQRQLVNAQSEYNYLSGVLDSKTGLRNVEQIAVSNLGLMKLDKSQITYVTLENESTIRRPQSGIKRFTEELSKGWLSLMDYLNP